MTVPCGFDSRGLPIGMQLIGRPFDEASLLRSATRFSGARIGTLDDRLSERCRSMEAEVK